MELVERGTTLPASLLDDFAQDDLLSGDLAFLICDSHLDLCCDDDEEEDDSRSANSVQNSIDSVEEKVGSDVNLSQLVAAPSKKRRRTSLVFFPRILKKDVRRELPTMFVNIMNSLDTQLMSSFYHTFCVPSLRTVDLVVTEKGSMPIGRIDGLEQSVARVTASLPQIPDFICTVEWSRISRRYNEPGSKVALRMHVTGTKMIYSNREYDIKEIPAAMDLHCTVLFFLDNDNRVYRMEVAYEL